LRELVAQLHLVLEGRVVPNPTRRRYYHAHLYVVKKGVPQCLV